MQVMSMNNHRLNMMSSLECESVQSRPKSKEANLKIALQLPRTRVQHKAGSGCSVLAQCVAGASRRGASYVMSGGGGGRKSSVPGGGRGEPESYA